MNSPYRLTLHYRYVYLVIWWCLSAENSRSISSECADAITQWKIHLQGACVGARIHGLDDETYSAYRPTEKTLDRILIGKTVWCLNLIEQKGCIYFRPQSAISTVGAERRSVRSHCSLLFTFNSILLICRWMVMDGNLQNRTSQGGADTVDAPIN